MRPACLAILFLSASTTALAYIHVPPTTLKGVCKDVSWIRVLTVKELNADKGGVGFEITEVLRDNKRWKSGVVSHRMIVPADAPGGKAVLQKLTPGKSVVLFSSEGEGAKPFAFGYACFGEGWYSVHYSPQSKCWLMLRGEPDLSKCYHGDVKDLPGFVRATLEGKTVKVPTREPQEKIDHFERARQIEDAMRKERGEK